MCARPGLLRGPDYRTRLALLPAQPTRGQVFFADRDITGRPPHAICQLGIGRSFQRTNIFPRMSVFDNLQIAVLSHQRRTLNMLTPARALVHDETMALLDSVGLAGEERSTSGTLSYGLQKQLELGIALASEPQVLLLDEPTAGMSPQETADTIALIGRIVRDRGLTYAATPPEGTTLVAGTWWSADHVGAPEVSFAAEEAAEG